MELVITLPSVRRDELRRYINNDAPFFLVASRGKPLLVLSKGTERQLSEVPELIKDVAIYAMDRWEILDLLNGELELPVPDGKVRAPNVIDLSISLDGPVELLIKVEGALLEALRELGPKYSVAVESIKARGDLIQGFTGRNIFILNMEFSGYSLDDLPLKELAREVEGVLGRELGFDARVHITNAELRKTSKLPLVRFTRAPIVPAGGRIIELSLRKKMSRRIPGINKKRLEVEVERLLKEAGVSQELLSALKSEKKEVSPALIEREVVRRLPNVKGLRVNWVKAIKTGEGYAVAIGIDRTSRSLSDEKIRDLFEGVLKRAFTSLKAEGIEEDLTIGYVVIEKDVY